jgi:hypothetical protein
LGHRNSFLRANSSHKVIRGLIEEFLDKSPEETPHRVKIAHYGFKAKIDSVEIPECLEEYLLWVNQKETKDIPGT